MSQTSEQLTNLLEIQLKEILSDQYLLFDTCVISSLSGSKSESPTKELFDFLNRIKCVPGISEHIYVECLRGHKSKEWFDKAKEFLNKFPKKRVDEDRVPNFFEKMIMIDRINQKYGLDGKQVSYVDLSTSVFLHNWPGNLFLATFDIKDFSHKIFDIFYIIPLIINNELCSLGIIKANKANFLQEKSRLTP